MLISLLIELIVVRDYSFSSVNVYHQIRKRIRWAMVRAFRHSITSVDNSKMFFCIFANCLRNVVDTEDLLFPFVMIVVQSFRSRWRISFSIKKKKWRELHNIASLYRTRIFLWRKKNFFSSESFFFLVCVRSKQWCSRHNSFSVRRQNRPSLRIVNSSH